mgnify:CR=1 FL=1
MAKPANKGVAYWLNGGRVKVEKWIDSGIGYDELARLMNISQVTLHRWRREYPEFSELVGTELTGVAPKLSVDRELFERLCAIQATKEEIAFTLGVSESTISAWCQRTYGTSYIEAWKKFSVDGKTSIRRAQFKKGVEDGDKTMLIWLGKQYLGQSDKQEVRSEIDIVQSAAKYEEYFDTIELKPSEVREELKGEFLQLGDGEDES